MAMEDFFPHLVDLRILILIYGLRFHGFRATLFDSSFPLGTPSHRTDAALSLLFVSRRLSEAEIKALPASQGFPRREEEENPEPIEITATRTHPPDPPGSVSFREYCTKEKIALNKKDEISLVPRLPLPRGSLRAAGFSSARSWGSVSMNIHLGSWQRSTAP
ncbi:hypothetical protein EK904_014132 [Melospiza melodia maxima]|nr:hypothetical protein EK904_014132 [Melospiza melodia maxima]